MKDKVSIQKLLRIENVHLTNAKKRIEVTLGFECVGDIVCKAEQLTH